MKPIYAVIGGCILILVGAARLLADKDVSPMDSALNVVCFAALGVGVMALIKGLFEGNKG